MVGVYFSLVWMGIIMASDLLLLLYTDIDNLKLLVNYKFSGCYICILVDSTKKERGEKRWREGERAG